MKEFIKYLLFLSVFIGFAYILIISDKDETQKEIVEENINKVSEEIKVPKILDTDILDYTVIIHEITDLKLKVISNFQNKLTSDEVLLGNNCQVLVNGGFYDENRNPLGLYYIDGKLINDKKSNTFLNGVFTVDSKGKYNITNIEKFNDAGDLIYYLQSGPTFVYDGNTQKVYVNNPGARRIMLAEDDRHRWHIIVVYKKDNFNDGPDFNSIESVLTNIKSRENINFLNVLNLDGGNSSLFIDENHSIKESSFAGSFLCFWKD